MTALQVSVPMVVTGAGQDKGITTNLVQLTGVGVNLGSIAPGVDRIREGVNTVLGDGGYKRRVVDMSKNFERYDVGTAFDTVIQGVVREWANGQQKGQ